MVVVSVDWSEFKDGDRVRVTFEGTFKANGVELEGRRGWTTFYQPGYLDAATSAELIERPFVPPAEGKLFRRNTFVYISLGDEGFRYVRDSPNSPSIDPEALYRWDSTSPQWRDELQELDV